MPRVKSLADANLLVVFETHATSLDNESGLASGWFDDAVLVIPNPVRNRDTM